jgi:DNA polymerase III alpha subunit
MFVGQCCIFVSLLKTDTASLFTLGVIRNIIILSCFNFAKAQNEKHIACRQKVDECLKTIHETFHVEIYIELKPHRVQNNIHNLYILELYSSVVKISTILTHFVKKKLENIDRIAMVID